MMNQPQPEKRPVQIRTPDHRLRVFVSSTLRELEDERRAVRQAIVNLHLNPVMFESGARPHPPQDLYQAYLSQSQVFIGIYWQSYGWIGPGMDISGLEDEYIRSAGLPRLIYIKTPAPNIDPTLKHMLERIRDENTASYKYFKTTRELKKQVEDDLILLLTEYFEASRVNDQTQIRPVPDRLTNLPVPRNPLIGREHELETACSMLLREDIALLTLTGPAGTGKSRLGIQIALEMRDHFEDGVFLIVLESIRDPGLVIPSIAKTLKLTETAGGLSLLDLLKGILCKKKMLLLLDNFEQVLPAATDIAELLEACPHIKILITSRAPLRLRAEVEFPVPPLRLPPHNQIKDDLEYLTHYSAVELFIQRCQAVKADFHVTDENAPAIAEICHRLDGLPLAIELAAARIKLMPPKILLSRLEHRFDLLRGGTQDLPERQQTMYNAIDWSYSLLEKNDKKLLQRLSVFNGGWTIDAAIKVCKYDRQNMAEVLDGLERLLENNLLLSVEEISGTPRMKMLESIREFSQQHLQESGESDSILRRFARYFLEFAWQAESELQGAAQHTWHMYIDDEIDNLRAVMEWAIRQGESEAALHITTALWRYWWFHGYWSEGFRWLQAALTGRGDIPDVLKAKALTQCGWYYRNLGDFPRAISTLQKSLILWRQVDDQTGYAMALSNMGACLLRQGNIHEAVSNLEEALVLAKRQGDTVTTYLTLENLGHVASKEGNLGKANELYDEALVLAEEKHDEDQVAKLLSNLGDNCVILGDFRRAEEYFSKSAVICKKYSNHIVGAYVTGNRSIIAMKEGNYTKAFDLLVEATLALQEVGDRENIILCLDVFAYLATELGEFSRAVRLFGASETLRIWIGTTRAQQMQVDYDAYIKKLVSQLGEAAFHAAWDEGSLMSLEQAVRYAVERDRYS